MHETAPEPPTRYLPRPRRRKDRGQAIVEMAFVLPIFLLIVMATIDFGMAFQRYITITNAAREGARVGVVSDTSAEAQSAAENRLTGALSSATVTVPDWNEDVTVRVVYDYEFITPIGGFLNLAGGGNSLKLTSSTTMKREE